MRLKLCAWLLLIAAAAMPVSADAAPAELLFVVNQEGASISVIDPEGLEVIATISVAPGPAAAAYWPKLGRLFIAHPEIGQVSVVDVASLAVVSTFEVPGTPFGIAVDPHGRLLITDWNEHCVHVVDAGTGAPIARINVGQSPAGIVSGTSHAYVANRESDSVSIIDLATLEVAATVPVGDAPFAIALSPDEAQVLVANVRSSDMSVIEARDPDAVGTIKTGSLPYGIGFSPSGDRIVVANQQSGTVSIFARPGFELLHTVRIGAYPEGVAVSSDGRRAFIANWFSDDLSVVDLEAGKEIRRIKTGKGPRTVILMRSLLQQ